MSDTPRVLLETAEGWIKAWDLIENWAEAAHERRMVNALVALTAERDALKAALRVEVIETWSNEQGSHGACVLCASEWLRNAPEHHAPGCLAAPEDAPK